MKRRDFVSRDEIWKVRQSARVRASDPRVGSFMQALWWQNETWAEVTYVGVDRIGLVTMNGFYGFLFWELKPVVMRRPPRDSVFLSFIDSHGQLQKFKREFPSHFYLKVKLSPLPSPYEKWVDDQVLGTMSS